MATETKLALDEHHLGTPATLCEAFQRSAAAHADQVALRTHGESDQISWSEYSQRVEEVAAGLAALGIGRGDTVAMMLSNRPEAFIVDTAALHLGATPFSIYNTSAPEQIAYLLGNAESRVVVCETQYAEQISAARASLPALEHVFVVGGTAAGTREFCELGTLGEPDFDFEAGWRAVRPDDVAVLIYTSGTTGPPKGVEITHSNVIADFGMTMSVFPGLREHGRMLSYLPMAHLADRMVAHYPALLTGATITCLPNARQISDALLEVRPTFYATVPRMWEKAKAAIEISIEREPDERRRAEILGALDAGIRKVRLEIERAPVPPELAEQCRRADARVFSRLRAQLGFDRSIALLSGGAPIDAEVLEFFAALGLPICETWGMSETTSSVTTSRPGAIRIGTVGQALPGVELKLAADGEVLVRGPNVMRGYHNDPRKTAEAIDPDGWLHTGDIGELDADGYLKIVDRKKELIINAAGKNMSPSNIENKLKSASHLIGPAVAIGDRRPYNSALIVLDPDAVGEFARTQGLADASVARLAGNERVQAEIAAAVQRANAQLSRVEQIKKFTILPVEWLPDSDELTPTLKLKRRAIAQKYAAEIDAMYVR
ncbi:MAG TPA: long-chain fatty acid--CoA ligase [Solirubrobacteraceae bacterium]|nr:long-chain fatty acid--CoA ligase [Solirubrobacteraceae bacterium]